MTRSRIEPVIRYGTRCRDPLSQSHHWYVLIGLASQARTGRATCSKRSLGEGHTRGLVADATIADSLDPGQVIRRVRELFGEVQRHLGGSIKHDVSVPVAAVPPSSPRANAAVTADPGRTAAAIRSSRRRQHPLHVNQPEGARQGAFVARWDGVTVVGLAVVARVGGWIWAERGMGVLKRGVLPRVKAPVALDLMRTLKRRLDPKDILSPGKVL